MGTLLCFTKVLVTKNFMEKRGEEEERGSIKILRRFFLVSLPKKIVGDPFIVSLISGIEKCYACEGYVTYFCRNFLSRTIEKLRRGTLLCFTKFWVSKNFMEKRGERKGGSNTIFRQNFLVSVPKKFVREPFSVSLFSDIEQF